MTVPSDSLTEDEVRHIVELVQALEQSSFDFLQVEIGSLKVTIGKGAMPHNMAEQPRPMPAAPIATAGPAAIQKEPSTTTGPQPSLAASSDHDKMAGIRAPIMGRFYRSPEPGSDPFVSIGQRVEADTTVALIEVMKVFTAVRADISGTIAEICAEDGAFVEFQDVLFRVDEG